MNFLLSQIVKLLPDFHQPVKFKRGLVIFLVLKKILFLLFLFYAWDSGAKDLTHRLGIGFRNSYFLDLPSISSTYYPSPEYGFIGSLGIDTADQASRFAFGLGFRKIIFKEENLNFFMGVHLTSISAESGTLTDSGFELSAVVGTEFFLQGLENLGFNVETGMGVTNIRKVRFRTLADHMLRAGITFYF